MKIRPGKMLRKTRAPREGICCPYCHPHEWASPAQARRAARARENTAWRREARAAH